MLTTADVEGLPSSLPWQLKGAPVYPRFSESSAIKQEPASLAFHQPQHLLPAQAHLRSSPLLLQHGHRQHSTGFSSLKRYRF